MLDDTELKRVNGKRHSCTEKKELLNDNSQFKNYKRQCKIEGQRIRKKTRKGLIIREKIRKMAA